MNKSQAKARQTRFKNQFDKMDMRPSYEIQMQRIKDGDYEDTRKRVQ